MLSLTGLGVLLLYRLLPAGPQPVVFRPAVPYDPARSAAPPGSPYEVSRIPVERDLQPGQTLIDVLSDLGFEPAEAYRAAGALADYLDVRHLKAGQPYFAYYTRDSRLAAVEWPVGEEGRALLERAVEGADDGADDVADDGSENAWVGSFVPYERRVEVRSVSGTLEDSLIGSVVKAGAPEKLVYEMAWVLQWDLDFNRDLRAGDRFRVLFEEIYLDGQYAGLGGILALAYENGGRTLEAFRFGDDDSFYDAEGRPLEKMFLRSPLRFSRITSRFSHRRFHPILKRYRPHLGVDYGAPVGTPVRVTANGVVRFAGRNGGAGRMVKVRHPNDYLTAYLHLSRVAKGIRPGRRVSQGQVIGYVGSSGLSTGPHLDYRVQHRGRWINPLSLKSVPAEPIPEAELAEFGVWRDALLASLEHGAPLPEELRGPAPEDRPRLAETPAVGAVAAR
jgi:murein DD-endopeptidase MepM/ murein hydrolase activator NlpD